MTLRPDLMFFPLDDDVVVFSEEAQCLVGLNASAALVARNLQHGLTASEIASGLASDGIAAPEDAARWVSATLDALGSNGMLADARSATVLPTVIAEEQGRATRLAKMPAFVPFEPKWEQRYRLLNVCALIRFAMLEQVPWVNSVIGHLATEDSAVPTIALDIQATRLNDGETVRSFVYRDGEPVEFVTGLNRLGPVVKGALWQSAVNAYDFLFYIHAGVVGIGESCVLLPAAPGSGKSSLTAALVHKGFGYFSDEVALIERGTFLVPPMPMALCVKSTGWDVIARYHPEIGALVSHERMDGKVVRYVPPPARAIQRTGGLVSHIVFPRYDKDAETELKPIARSDALGRLMVECLALRQRLTPANVADLIRWIAGINCYALTFSSLDEACGLISKVVGRANYKPDVPKWHNS
jgi:hypothetical protein